MSEEELKEVSEKAGILHSTSHKFDSQRHEQFMKTRVYARIAVVAGVRDIVRYHGFQPSERTPGLAYLDRLIPVKDLRRVDT